MPDCAPVIIGMVKPGEAWPERRRWKVKSDFDDNQIEQRRRTISDRASGQRVQTFVSNEWTLEYDLAFSGLGRELWLAISLAAADERIAAGNISAFDVTRQALRSWKSLAEEALSDEERASKVYARLATGSVSKPITAQYLARVLTLSGLKHRRTADEWRAVLPPYLVAAIDYVTAQGEAPIEPAEEVAEPDQQQD